MPISDIGRLLGEEFVGDLAGLSMTEVRQRRDDCQEAADALSYLRRLVQGRLDIVGAELARRAGGHAAGDMAELVEQLKRGEILADAPRTGGFGRLPMTFAAADTDGWIAAELEQIAGAAKLATLPELSDEDLRATADSLTELEHRVSSQRGQLHDRTNVLQEEIVRRYKSGEASVESLLQ